MRELTIIFDDSTQEIKAVKQDGMSDIEIIAILFSTAVGLAHENGLDRQATLVQVNTRWFEMNAKEETK